MNPLKKLFDSTEKYFSSSGRLKILSPLFDATKTFFFLPSPRARHTPFVRDNMDLKRLMSFVILSLMPVLFFGIYNTGLQAGIAAGKSYGVDEAFFTGLGYVLPILMVTYGVGFFWEILFASLRGHKITEGLLVTGLLFPLTLPPTIPLWQVAVGISFGVVVGKELFGGTGRNVFNPALTGRAFLFFSYPLTMSGGVWIAGKTAVDGISGATALAVTAPEGQTITTALSDLGFSLPNLFFGFVPGSIGETSAFCCLLGAAFLILTRVANFRIIISGIAGLVLTSLVLCFIPGDKSTWMNAGPLYHLCTGGFMFGITFMATDPVSGPGTDPARWIFGFLIGFLTVIIRVANPAYVEGAMLAILFMNVFAPLLDHMVMKYRISRRIPNV